MNAYHRMLPLADEERSHYTPEQLGAWTKIQLTAARQAEPGRFRSVDALKGALPAAYALHVDFLLDEGELVEQKDGSVLWGDHEDLQKGDITVAERMRRMRARKAAGEPPPAHRNATRNADRNSAVTSPVTPASQGDEDVTLDHSVPPSPQTPQLPPSTGVGVGFPPAPPTPPPSAGRLAVDGPKTETERSTRRTRASTGPPERQAPIEMPEVIEYLECWMSHSARPPSEADREWARRIPFEFDRLNPATVLAEIDALATRFKARGTTMPKMSYLRGRLTILQAEASDAGQRPRQRRAPPGLQRLAELLPAGMGP